VGKAWLVEVRYIRQALQQLTEIPDCIDVRSPGAIEIVIHCIRHAARRPL
jgi:hypothetical protein